MSILPAADAADAADVRLSPRHALILHLVACWLFLSGGSAALYDILEATDSDLTLPLAFKAWALTVHGGAAMVFMVLVGSVLPIHVARAWRSKRNRVIGSLILGIIGSLMLTGYGLYYLGNEDLRLITQWTHLSLGIVEPPLFLLHLFLGRKSRLDRA